ncbi:hypothetical protein CIP107550_02066 [Corynebacterium diphtheriae]|nr:hypothetical protein CIP107550_02066 [Corynebacterium diphtheriae]
MLGWWLKARRVELDAVQQGEATPDELKAEIRKLRRDIATLKMEKQAPSSQPSNKTRTV